MKPKHKHVFFKVLLLGILVFMVENTLVEENTVYFVDDDYMDMDPKDLDVKVQQNPYTSLDLC